MFEIIPSPGTENKDFSEVEKKIESIRGAAKTIHIDVIDGKFADNTTFLDPSPFAKYAKDLPAGKAGFILEAHFMVQEPIQYLKPFADAGFQRFIGQVEKMSDQVEFVAKAQDFGEVGLAIDKQTSVEDIHVSLEDLDTLLVMTIQAGFSGQKFEEELLKKVKELASKTLIPIEVDGGINDEAIIKAAKAGASRFVATNFIFGKDNSQKQIKILEEALKTVILI